MLMDRFRLDGKVALVTGSGRGIGRGCALAFAEQGAHIVCSARTQEQIDDTAAEARRHGVEALAQTCDVSDPAQMDAAVALGAPVIELHTGAYCDARQLERGQHLDRIITAAAHSAELGLECHAGHGLTFDTVGPVAALPEIVELNIGHFLIGEAIFGGLESAINRMRVHMDKARANSGTAKSA